MPGGRAGKKMMSGHDPGEKGISCVPKGTSPGTKQDRERSWVKSGDLTGWMKGTLIELCAVTLLEKVKVLQSFIQSFQKIVQLIGMHKYWLSDFRQSNECLGRHIWKFIFASRSFIKRFL